jgi:hypothetical protein
MNDDNRSSSLTVSPSEVRQARATWKQPGCRIGTPIVWYRGNRPDNNPMTGFVRVVDTRSQTIVAHVVGDPQGEIKDKCRHVSDPVLALGRDTADGGCWDFSPDHIDTIRRFASLESQVSELRRDLLLKAPSRTNETVKGKTAGSKASDFSIES